MNEKLKEAFEQIQAEEALKSKTKEWIFQRTQGYTRTKAVKYRRFIIPAVACALLLLFGGGYWLYFTPTVEISIDINPSMEMGVNRFDRIISMGGDNDEGQALINSLDIQYMNYSEAVNRIMENKQIAALLSSDEIMTITVVGTDETQSARVLSNIQACTEGKGNTYCYSARSDEAGKARELGLSYGKYKAYLEIQALDPTVTAAEVQNMTMREIRNLLEQLTGDPASGTTGCGNGNGGRQGGNGNGRGQGNGREPIG